jgi:hypothetical protein
MLPPHTPVHVMPAAQSCVRSPLHLMWHAAVPPHATTQDVLPVQSAVQPPFGQSMAQLLFPSQETVEPVSSESLQSLPPVQVTLLLTPVLSVHVLVPAQLDVQLAAQLPAQLERPSHVFVQPVPQVRSQVFLVSQ